MPCSANWNGFCAIVSTVLPFVGQNGCFLLCVCVWNQADKGRLGEKWERFNVFRWCLHQSWRWSVYIWRGDGHSQGTRFSVLIATHRTADTESKTDAFFFPTAFLFLSSCVRNTFTLLVYFAGHHGSCYLNPCHPVQDICWERRILQHPE